ncbi:hypothetical protein BH10PSE4_BH10PSE4_27030 [soil metagenome]
MASSIPLASQPAWLKVCVTCSRFDERSPGQASVGEGLADAIDQLLVEAAFGDALALRRVPCLSGCKHPGNIALGAPDKTKLRLNAVTAGDAPAIVRLAAAYLASADGEPANDSWPGDLKGHLATTIRAHKPAELESFH